MKKQKVVSVSPDQLTDTVVFALACGHQDKVKGWSIALSMGPIDVTERECPECAVEEMRSGKLMLNLKELLSDAIGQNLLDLLARIEEADSPEAQKELSLTFSTDCDRDIESTLRDLGDRMVLEAQNWTKGSRSLVSRLRVLTAEAVGDHDAAKAARKLR